MRPDLTILVAIANIVYLYVLPMIYLLNVVDSVPNENSMKRTKIQYLSGC